MNESILSKNSINSPISNDVLIKYIHYLVKINIEIITSQFIPFLEHHFHILSNQKCLLCKAMIHLF